MLAMTILLGSQVQKVNRLSLDLSTLAEVLEDDARWMVSQEKSF